MTTLGFIGNLGLTEWLILAVLAVLIFGRRLPEVGKNLGKGIVEFKKGLSGIEDDVKTAGAAPQNTTTASTVTPNQITGTSPQASADVKKTADSQPANNQA